MSSLEYAWHRNWIAEKADLGLESFHSLQSIQSTPVVNWICGKTGCDV